MQLIELTQGQVALVDDEDFERINSVKWYADKSDHTYYARRRISKYGKMEHMHRIIMGLPDDPSLFVDHKDGNGLNNQKHNLRIATRSQNNANKKPIGKSKHLGVFYQAASTKRPWYSCILKNRQRKYLGSFHTEEEAALAYNKAATEIHGEFANLNVIDEAANIYGARD